MLRRALDLPNRLSTRLLVLIAAIAIVGIALMTAMPSASTRSSSSKVSRPAPAPARAGGSTSVNTSAEMTTDAVIGKSATPASSGGSEGIAATTDIAPSAGGATSSIPSIDEKVMRSGSVTVRVPRGSFADRWRQAAHVATALGGTVSASSSTNEPKVAPSGTMTLRVPASKFDEAVAMLGKVGTVRAATTTSQAVTQEYVDTASRLRHDRAVERRLLALLARTSTVSEALAVQNQLDAVQAQIEVEAGRMQYLDSVTDYATLEVAMSESGKHARSAGANSHGAGTITHALSVSWHRFVATIAAGIVLLGSVLPWLLLGGAVWAIGTVIVRRRQRERAEG